MGQETLATQSRLTHPATWPEPAYSSLQLLHHPIAWDIHQDVEMHMKLGLVGVALERRSLIASGGIEVQHISIFDVSFPSIAHVKCKSEMMMD